MFNLAGAFYSFKTILIPHNLPPETLAAHLKSTHAEALIAEAGSLDLSIVTQVNEQLSSVVWVAKYGNRHMDWHGVPAGVKGDLAVHVWHELVEEHKDLAGLEVPEYDPTTPTPAIKTVWPSSSQAGEFIDFKPEVRPSVPSSCVKRELTMTIEHCRCCWRLGIYFAS